MENISNDKVGRDILHSICTGNGIYMETGNFVTRYEPMNHESIPILVTTNTCAYFFYHLRYSILFSNFA